MKRLRAAPAGLGPRTPARAGRSAAAAPTVTLNGQQAHRLLKLARLRGVGVGDLLDELVAMAAFDAAASGACAATPGAGGGGPGRRRARQVGPGLNGLREPGNAD